ncbi:MAG: ATP phosphoribosyltransferase regulatory subunit, partial [Sedimentisphaerales bacterium]|nr:ATP phosphoribosyltransferase regulatory subunit [Sedimentisphaerales bacterium]
MKIQAVKGTRDFYPAQMAVRNFIIDGWKRTSLRNGFEEYDGPIFEYLKMYQAKSGDEIVEQLFNFTDRGDRHLAIRPEITPTLARMVNQQVNSLPRPIKWFSVPRLCRAERPQKGRLREFFQWNIDIIGVDDVLADAEVIFTSIDYLRSLGLTAKDIKAKISSRKLLAAFLKNIGIPKKKLEAIYPVLDKKPKLPKEAFDEMLAKVVPDKDRAKKIKDFMELEKVSDIKKVIESSNHNVDDAAGELAMLFDTLSNMGVGDYCIFDPSIVRGLAYYTGIVFEIHDAVGD